MSDSTKKGGVQGLISDMVARDPEKWLPVFKTVETCKNNGRLIQTFRKQANMTTEQLANKLHIPESELQSMECGKAEHSDKLTDHAFIVQAINACRQP